MNRNHVKISKNRVTRDFRLRSVKKTFRQMYESKRLNYSRKWVLLRMTEIIDFIKVKDIALLIAIPNYFTKEG